MEKKYNEQAEVPINLTSDYCKFCDNNFEGDGYKFDDEGSIVFDADVCEVCRSEIISGLKDEQDVQETNNSLRRI